MRTPQGLLSHLSQSPGCQCAANAHQTSQAHAAPPPLQAVEDFDEMDVDRGGFNDDMGRANPWHSKSSGDPEFDDQHSDTPIP